MTVLDQEFVNPNVTRCAGNSRLRLQLAKNYRLQTSPQRARSTLVAATLSQRASLQLQR